MSAFRTGVIAALAMLAFAANSLLCRSALLHSSIDAASFTAIRLGSGAVVLCLLVMLRKTRSSANGNWLSALALFVYAAAFSYAYSALTTATGALLLFGAVQSTMLLYSLFNGERLTNRQWCGFVLAVSGLIALLLPGLTAPPLAAAALMLLSGVAWGCYSIRGKSALAPTAVTAGNFVRTLPFVLVLCVITLPNATLDNAGVIYAVASGAVASGLGYALWYAVLPTLKSTTAATIQLSVPVLAAVGGVVILHEAPSYRLVIASAVILGGIALVILNKGKTAS